MGSDSSTQHSLCPFLHNICTIDSVLQNEVINKIELVNMEIMFNKQNIKHSAIMLTISEKAPFSSNSILIVPDYVKPLQHEFNQGVPFHVEWPISIKYPDFAADGFCLDNDQTPLTDAQTLLEFDSLTGFPAYYGVKCTEKDKNYNIKLKGSGINPEIRDILIETLVNQQSFLLDIVDIIEIYLMNPVQNLIIHPPYIQMQHRFVCTIQMITTILDMKYIDLREVQHIQWIDEDDDRLHLSLFERDDTKIYVNDSSYLSFPNYVSYDAVPNTNDMEMVLIPQKLNSFVMSRLELATPSAIAPYRLYRAMFPQMFIDLRTAFSLIDDGKENILRTKIVEICYHEHRLLFKNLVSYISANGLLANVKSDIIHKFGGIVIYRWSEDRKKQFKFVNIGGFQWDTLYIFNKEEVITNLCAFATVKNII